MTLEYRGFPACYCQTQWLPVFERELQELGLLKGPLPLAQLIGGAVASKGVHLGGGNIDWWSIDQRWAIIARQMGAPATWIRKDGSFAKNQHTHCGLRGCPHMTESGKAQIAEVDRGGDGLLGNVPDDPALRPFHNQRTWQEGVAWAKKRQLVRRRNISVGTHNLGDDRGTATGFADIIGFTEAIPKKVRKELGSDYVVRACGAQKDLVLAHRRGMNVKIIRTRYWPAHTGIPKVTPHRGTWEVELEVEGVRVIILIEHRINAAFEPFRRGERFIRSRFWKLHTGITKARIRKGKKRRIVVIAMGDTNTPGGVQAYGNRLYEVGDHFDRIGASKPLTNKKVLSDMGSPGHNRLVANIQL